MRYRALLVSTPSPTVCTIVHTSTPTSTWETANHRQRRIWPCFKRVCHALPQHSAHIRSCYNIAYACGAAGELQGLQQQLDSFSERLVEGLTQLEGVSSSSMQHLQEQSATLADAVAVSNSHNNILKFTFAPCLLHREQSGQAQFQVCFFLRRYSLSLSCGTQAYCSLLMCKWYAYGPCACAGLG